MSVEMVQCPVCGEVNPARRAVCSGCGKVLHPGGAIELDWDPERAGNEQTAPARSRVLRALIAILVLALFGSVAYLLIARRTHSASDMRLANQQIAQGQSAVPAFGTQIRTPSGGTVITVTPQVTGKVPGKRTLSVNHKPPTLAKPTPGHTTTPAAATTTPSEQPAAEQQPDLEELAESLQAAAQHEARELAELDNHQGVSEASAQGADVPARYFRRGPTTIEMNVDPATIRATGSDSSPYQARVTGVETYLMTTAFSSEEDAADAAFTRQVTTTITWTFAWRNGAWVCTDMDSGDSLVTPVE